MSQIIKNVLSGSGGLIVETLTGNTGGAVPPTDNNISVLGSGSIVVTGSPGTSTLTISNTNGGFVWTDEAASFAAVPQNGYFCTATLTATMPASAGLTNGSTVIFYVDSSNPVTIQCNTGQKIQVGDSTSVSGGVAVSSSLYIGSTLTLVYRVVNSTWNSISSLGTWAVT